MLTGHAPPAGLFAIHIADGVLTPAWQAGGLAAAAVLLAVTLRRLNEQEVVRVGLFTAAFFVASQIHIKVGVSSVHLMLNGVVGLVLRRFAPLAIAGSLARKRATPEGPGTLQVETPTFALTLIAVVVILTLLQFMPVLVLGPVAEHLAERDVKGLYKKALAGEIANFTGVSDPYEPPLYPEVVCYSDGRETPEQSAAKVIAKLETLGYIERRAPVAAANNADSAYTDEEEDEVTDRLRDLGYL